MTLAQRFEVVREQIALAAARSGRDPSAVNLVVVSKMQSANTIRAAVESGARSFGENYVQELRAKQSELSDLSLEWHFVGRLQKNKAKDIVGRVAVVHSVDSIELAAVIDRRAAQSGVTQQVLLEVNLGGETTKAGFSPDDLSTVLEQVNAFAAIQCVGLMTIPPPVDCVEDNRPHFRRLAKLARQFGLTELSMGMSEDYVAAVEEGATIVRVGTAILGPRPGHIQAPT